MEPCTPTKTTIGWWLTSEQYELETNGLLWSYYDYIYQSTLISSNEKLYIHTAGKGAESRH